MIQKKTNLVKSALHAIHRSGMGHLAAPLTAGRGVIFMLHHVRSRAPHEFEPNRILAISPEFLEALLEQVIAAGYEPISMDDLPERLFRPKPDRPFACFTFDDGYRDNRDIALPIFRKFGVPMTIYVPSSFADGEGDLWWLMLEEVIRRHRSLDIEIDGQRQTFQTETVEQKWRAFDTIYWYLRRIPELQARDIVRRLGQDIGVHPTSFCRDLVMNWDELRDLAADPLVTIGAHTHRHLAVAKLTTDQARTEIAESVQRIETELGRSCRHFSFPYGDELSAGERDFALCKALGLATAVTTRKGLLHSHHRNEMTGLPRLSLNGDYQEIDYVKALLSGLPFAINDAVRRWTGFQAA